MKGKVTLPTVARSGLKGRLEILAGNQDNPSFDNYLFEYRYCLYCRCIKKCFSKIDEEQRNEILKSLLSLKNKNEQDLYIQSHIKAFDVQRRRPRKLDVNRKKEIQVRRKAFKFFISVNTEKIEVCKAAFMSMFDVTNVQIQRLQNLIVMGKLPQDMRGQQPNQKTVPVDIVCKVVDHINSFPRKSSHYGPTDIEYFSSKLNITIMHRMFLLKYPNLKVSYSFYYKIFKTRFNLKFGRLQVDACCECERLGTRLKNYCLNPEVKRLAATEMLIHKRRANKFYKSLKATSELCRQSGGTSVCLTMDYMQNISLPTIPVQDMFYYRQLSVFPFGIHNTNDEKSTIYLYHEGIAKKGPNEVCSFLGQYIKNMSSEVTELYLYSDNCAGQNKNHTLLRFLLSLTDTKQFNKIVYRLPIRGHSFLPNDRDFGLIKRCLRRTDRYYDIDDVAKMILESSNESKFSVNFVKTEDVLDFKNWWPLYYKKTAESEESKILNHNKKLCNKRLMKSKKCSTSQSYRKLDHEMFKISTYHEFQFDSENPGVVTACEFIDGFTSRRYTFGHAKRSKVNPPTNKAYNSRIPILASKMDDLKKTLQYIPDSNKEFLSKIITKWPTRLDTQQDTDNL